MHGYREMTVPTVKAAIDQIGPRVLAVVKSGEYPEIETIDKFTLNVYAKNNKVVRVRLEFMDTWEVDLINEKTHEVEQHYSGVYAFHLGQVVEYAAA